MEAGVSNSSFHEKYPLKKLEFQINKVIKVTSIHLDLLRHHKKQIEKFQLSGSWDKLGPEALNASRTVQQLKTDIDEMEVMTHQNVMERDLPVIQARFEPIRQQIQQEIHDFLALTASESFPSGPKMQQTELSPSSSLLFGEVQNQCCASTLQEQQLLEESVENTHMLMETWQTLKQDLDELNGALNTFARLVATQGEKVNTIDHLVTEAKDNVEESKSLLKKAAILKSGTLPVAGAAVGCALAGPVGLVVGLKLAGALAICGGILGYTSGRVYQKRKLRTIEEVELLPVSTTAKDS